MSTQSEEPIANQSLGKQLRQASVVIVADFNMPFSSLVQFMVKVVIAAIPAVMILALFFVATVAVLSSFFGITNPIS